MLKSRLITGLAFLLTIHVIGQQTVVSYLDKNIRYDQKEQTVRDVLDEIENQLLVNFVYSNVVNTKRKVLLQSGWYPLEILLDSLFARENINFYTRNNLVILSPKDHIEGVEQISGQVVNDNGKYAIPYASVFIANSAVGTICNHSGHFLLNLKDVKLSDSIQISALGYETQSIPVRDFLAENIQIRLATYRIPIREIIIRHNDPVQLVKDSYNSRNKNYSTSEQYFQGYFREINRQDEKYISLSEALVEIEKRSFKASQNDWIKINKGRVGENVVNANLLNLVVQGGLYSNLQLDIVKYQNSFYSGRPDDDYVFWMERSIQYRNRHTYIIGFNQKENIQIAGFKGKLYIDAESLALAHAEFEFNSKAINMARDILIKKIANGYRARPEYARYRVDYRKIANQWVLSYTRTEIGIKVKSHRWWKGDSFACNFESASELVITNDLGKENARIRFKETARPTDVFVEQLKDPSVDYWEGQTIIPPEESLEKALQRLMQEGNLRADQQFLTFDRIENEAPQ